jgi:hypothetical protein
LRLFLFVLFTLGVYTAFAQQPEPTIGSTVDTARVFGADTSTREMVKSEPKIVKKDTSTVAKHSPKTATLLSLFIPGAGQVYNRKNWWWKVPIIYGGGITLLYAANFNHQRYLEYKRAYEFTVLNPGVPLDNPRLNQINDPTTLRANRNGYREARDQCYIGLGLLYALQIVDAAVEAHFFEFNVSDNLSLNVQPQFVPMGYYSYSGVQLMFTLK